jgi:hypothetical protein
VACTSRRGRVSRSEAGQSLQVLGVPFVLPEPPTAHGRYAVFQLAEVEVPRMLFAAILRRIDRLRGPPVVA